MTEEEERELKHYRQLGFENACDNLYYGYGYRFWYNHTGRLIAEKYGEAEAKSVWRSAFDLMAK